MGVAGCITLLVEAAAIREHAFILQHCVTGCYLSKKHPWEWRELRGSSRALHCDMMISATLWLILQVLWVLNIRKCNRMVYSWDMLKLEYSQCYKPNVFITFHRTLFIYFFYWKPLREDRLKKVEFSGRESNNILKKRRRQWYCVAGLFDSDAALALKCQQMWSVMERDVRICGWLWLAEGGERLMTHRLTSVPMRDWHSSTEIRHEFLSLKALSFAPDWGSGILHASELIWTCDLLCICATFTS